MKHSNLRWRTDWKVFLIAVLIIGLSGALQAQRKRRQKNKAETSQEARVLPSYDNPPKLVVGIVVDQMRYDYLTRFWSHYGEGGFRRLVRDGFTARNHHFDFAPTYTGPGHAAVYTGSVPAINGIIGNDWFSREQKKMVYCASDERRNSVGTASDAGRMSPWRMKTTTFTDQIRLHHQLRSKVVAVALKDRGAVLPGGHLANAAYWFEAGSAGNWISSDYYMNDLPDWVKAYNQARSVDAYKKVWNTLKPIALYTESGSDVNDYENMARGESDSGFPHLIPGLWDTNGQYSILRGTPFGNSLTTDFALAALENEALGVDRITDVLAISYSSTDYVGHTFGVNSKEVQDTYLRLDQDLERLLNELDRQVGRGEYVVFLSADHGAVHVPNYLKDLRVPAGYFDTAVLKDKLIEFAKYHFGVNNLITSVSNHQVFLDADVIRDLDMDREDVQDTLRQEIMKYDGVANVFTAEQFRETEFQGRFASLVQQGWDPQRSGDLMILLEPGYASYPPKGSTHGTAFNYDTHVPFLLYGKGVKPGFTNRRTAISDIAPTLCSMLGVAFPNGSIGDPVYEAIDR